MPDAAGASWRPSQVAREPAAMSGPFYFLTVPVGMGAAIVAVLRLPLAAVTLATLLPVHAGSNVEPLIIVAVVASHVITLVITRSPAPTSAPTPDSPATA